MLLQLRRQLDGKLLEYAQAKKQVKQSAMDYEDAKEHLSQVLEGQKLVQAVAEKVQQSAHRQLASVVTKSLQAVFGEEEAHEFLIQFAQKRGKTEASLCFAKDGEVYDNPRREVEGGAIDVAALALRLASLVLTKPTPRKLLCLDEPMRGLNGDENRKRFAQLLLVLSKEMGVQIILSSGHSWMKVGKVINLEGMD
jgi:ABC-type branched-subunit amino acid transport system ATPase component